LRTTRTAAVHARRLGLDVLPGPRPLGARLPEHVVFGPGKLLAPLGVRLDHLRGGSHHRLHASNGRRFRVKIGLPLVAWPAASSSMISNAGRRGGSPTT